MNMTSSFCSQDIVVQLLVNILCKRVYYVTVTVLMFVMKASVSDIP